MTLTKKTDHVDEALAHLLEQFKGAPKLHALLTSFVNQVQDLENVWFELLLDRWIESAEGVQLDGLGDIVGEAREGRVDADYREALEGRIVLNLGSGQPEVIIRLLNCANCNGGAELIEYFPASFDVRMRHAVMDIDAAERLAALIQSGKAAGVKAHLIFAFSPEAELFRFDSGPGYDQGKWAGAL